MLTIATELRASAIHGVGVFLLVPVKKGELIWYFDSRLDHIFNEQLFESLPVDTKQMIIKYAYWNKMTKLWVLPGDNTRNINHSQQPNLVQRENIFLGQIAATDIEANTELTINYYDACDYTRETGEL